MPYLHQSLSRNLISYNLSEILQNLPFYHLRKLYTHQCLASKSLRGMGLSLLVSEDHLVDILVHYYHLQLKNFYYSKPHKPFLQASLSQL